MAEVHCTSDAGKNSKHRKGAQEREIMDFLVETLHHLLCNVAAFRSRGSVSQLQDKEHVYLESESSSDFIIVSIFAVLILQFPSVNTQ